ncbi:MAG: EAL domain-containing protein [Chromatiales bacterium]|jgi:diguanylate cyclase (GGDEF)-like protein/PAS domain S-box-containing protein
MKQVSLTQLFIMSFVLVFVLPVIIISTLQQQRVKELSTEQIVDQLGKIADKKVDSIENYFKHLTEHIEARAKSSYTRENFQRLSQLYRADQTKNADYSLTVGEYTTDFRNTSSDEFSKLYFLTPEGEIFYSATRLPEQSGNSLASAQQAQLANAFQKTRSAAATTFSNFLPSQAENKTAAYVATPVIFDNDIIGVLALQVDRQNADAVLMDDSGLGKSGKTVIATKDQPDFQNFLKLSSQNTAEHRQQSAAAYADGLPGNPAYRGGGIIDEQGRSLIAVWRFIPVLESSMIVKLDAEEALQPVEQIELSGQIAVLGMLVFGVTFLVFLGRKIVRPIKQITTGAHALSQGIPYQVEDVAGFTEARTLASSFNKMANLIIEHQAQLEKRVLQRTEQLRERSDRLLAEIGFRLEVEKKLRRAHTIIEATSEAIFITNLIPEVIDVNPAYCELFGYAEEELLDKPLHVLIRDEHHQESYEQIWETVSESGHWHGEILQRHKHGQVIPALMTINSVYDDGGKLINYVGIITDIAQLKKTEKELEHLAYYDVLTGLPNRMLFYDRLNHEISRAKRDRKRLALLFIDLDGFKYVNDSLGHDEGDYLLKEVSQRLTSSIRENDTVSRLGGDEFTVIATNINSELNAARIANKLLKQLSQPVVLAGQEVFVGASIGISLFPDDGATSEVLVKNADAAMYKAKDMGKGTLHFYSRDLGEKNARHLQMESELRRALTNEEMFLLYQPQIDLHSGEMIGVEALIRWNHPSRGLVMPGEFIPLAEESRLIMEIDQWVIQTACRQLSEWNQNTHTRLALSINLSALQFQNKSLIKFITNAIKQNGIDAEQIELEITEGTLIQNRKDSEIIMKDLSELGVRITIDDFGTGYSSLSYMKKYPISLIKIDQSFICDIPDEDVDKAITQSIISFAKGIGVKTLAEGVEQESQHRFLQQNQCDYGQGFLYSHPVPATDIEHLITSKQALLQIN